VVNAKAFCCLVLMSAAALGAAGVSRPARFTSGPGAMAVLSFEVADMCAGQGPQDATALGVWVDGQYEHEVLVFPGSGRARYDSLLGPFRAGSHRVELRASRFWPPSRCIDPGSPAVVSIETGQPRHAVLSHAPVLEMRADTVGEQTDLPLFAYVEELGQSDRPVFRYTQVFTNEDGGTATRALYARWGRTADIEQVYEVELDGARLAREEFQGPDHEVRAFRGRRRGAAPVLLVATLNNMVIDRGRGVAEVRPVPEVVNLAEATRESVMDTRPWAMGVIAREQSREGHVDAHAPDDERWLRVAPDARHHVYFEARLSLDHSAVAAWVQDRGGRRNWSHYGRPALAVDRNGWVRMAVSLSAGSASDLAAAGWACLPAVPGTKAASCTVETARVFVFGDDWVPGRNLVTPGRFTLRPGEEGHLALSTEKERR
jgi:hypothetical protein